jgi:hypothetical protein
MHGLTRGRKGRGGRRRAAVAPGKGPAPFAVRYTAAGGPVKCCVKPSRADAREGPWTVAPLNRRCRGAGAVRKASAAVSRSFKVVQGRSRAFEAERGGFQAFWAVEVGLYQGGC